MIKKITKNRTNLGIACVVLALIICFVISPLIGKKASSKVEVIRVTKSIKQGQKITKSNISKVKVGGYNLPQGVITDEKQVLNKYAKVNMYKDDYIFKEKISKEAKDYYLDSSFNDKLSISATIRTSAAGLSGKLQEGDIITIIAKESEEAKAEIVEELMYVKVLATTTTSGLDNKSNEEDKDSQDMPNTVTIAVNDIQAEKVAQLESHGEMHFALVYRGGDKKKIKAYLDTQNEYFDFMEKNNMINTIYDVEGSEVNKDNTEE